ncbi:protein of unknown function [Stenotrophomonas maltophilia]|nr:protein of unknown function [Stenotrophomonas maltophilia]
MCMGRREKLYPHYPIVLTSTT